MSPARRQTIAATLTRMSMMVSGTALLLAYVSFLAYDWYSLRQELVSQLETEAAITGSNSVTALEFDDPQAAQATLSALSGSPHVLYAAIETPDGAIFAEYSRKAGSHAAPGLHLAGNESEQHWQLDGSVLLARQIVFGGKTLGTVYVLAETTDQTHRAVRFGIISAGILLLSFLIAVLATAAIRRLVTGPLTELARTAQVVSRERDYSVRARLPSSTDELALLVRSFNEMLEQIQQRDAMLEESRTVLELKVEERTAELKTANKELEAFSYSVAHDLRGPLQHISNIVYLLREMCGDGNPQTTAMLEKLDESSARMSRLIEDLLNLSSATSTPLRRKEIDLSGMAQSILKEFAAQSPGRQVETVVAAGARVYADEGLIRLVMENLLGNAWKYTSKTPQAKIEFGFEKSAEGTAYFVRDNGAGFDPALAERLFRPFQRLHTQEEFPGTGVGLATVQRILARHGGKIWARADVQRGTEFSFTVPDTGGETNGAG